LRRLWTGIVVALLLAGAGSARADERTDAQKKVAAQALFDEGRRLTKAGQYAEACPKLDESLRLDPSIGTKFYLAECLEHVGRLASAWTYYLEVADAARAGGQKDREKFANDRAAQLKPRLARLVIRVPDEVRSLVDLAVEHNAVAVGEAEWGIEVPIDLGNHLVRVRAKERKTWETTISANQEGALFEVKIPALVSTVPSVPPPPEVAPPPRVVPPPPPPPPPPAPQGVPARRIAGFVIGGAGLVGVAVGAAFGVRALDKKSDSNAGGHCDAQDTCDAQGLALRSDALSAATASTVGFIVGGVALGTGIVLIATAPSARPAVPRAAVGPGGASLAWRW
jgi:hypothetical protein